MLKTILGNRVNHGPQRRTSPQGFGASRLKQSSLGCATFKLSPRFRTTVCTQVRIDAGSSYRVPSPLVGEGQGEGTRAAARRDVLQAAGRNYRRITRTIQTPCALVRTDSSGAC